MMGLSHFKTAISLVFSLGQMNVVLKEQFNNIIFLKISFDDERLIWHIEMSLLVA